MLPFTNNNDKNAAPLSAAPTFLSLPQDNTTPLPNSATIQPKPTSSTTATIDQIKHTPPSSSGSTRLTTSTSCTTATDTIPANSNTASFTPASKDLSPSTEPLQLTTDQSASVSAAPDSTTVLAPVTTPTIATTPASTTIPASTSTPISTTTTTSDSTSTSDSNSATKPAPTTSTASTTKPASTTTTASTNKPTLKTIPVPPKPNFATHKQPDEAPSKKRSKPSKDQAASSGRSPKRIRTKPAFLATNFNADYTLALPDFLQQLKDVFDDNPDAFNTDADRIKYALQSMGEHPSRYFEPFLNKTVNDVRHYLTSYSQFLEIMQDKFGQWPSVASVCAATSQLSSLKQTGTIHSYITTFRDLTTIIRWDEPDLVRLFHSGLSNDVKSYITTPAHLFTLSEIQVAANRAYSKARSLQRSKLQSTLYSQPPMDSVLREQLQRVHQLRLQETFGVLQPPIQQLQQEPPQVQQLYQDTFGIEAPFNSIPPANPFTIIPDLVPDLSHQRLVHQTIHHPDYHPDDKIQYPNPAAARHSPGTGRTFVVRGKLSPEEKLYRKKNGLCWYCGGENHAVWNCSLKMTQGEKNVVHEG